MESQSKAPPSFPPGALLRVEQIVGNPKKGIPGLVPVCAATWWRWVKDGRVPAGRKLGPHVTAWPLEVVLAIGQPQAEQVQA
jgi:prophage regulatory protein